MIYALTPGLRRNHQLSFCLICHSTFRKEEIKQQYDVIIHALNNLNSELNNPYTIITENKEIITIEFKPNINLFEIYTYLYLKGLITTEEKIQHSQQGIFNIDEAGISQHEKDLILKLKTL